MFLERQVREGAAIRGRPPERLSVCFVAPHAWPVISGDRNTPVVGGAEVQQAILARLFAGAGHRVSMICLDFGQPEDQVVENILLKKAFRMKDGVPGLRFLHPRLTTMWRKLDEVDADVYYYRSAAMWVGVLAEFCRRRGRRLVYAGASDRDFDADVGGQIRYARDRWLYRRGVERADAVVAQNEHQLERLKTVYGRDDAVVIPSCYVLPKRKSNEEKDLILWVGTLHVNKRPEIFLQLAARLPRRRCVMIGGPGPDSAFYEETRRRAAALPNVEFRGFLPVAEAETWFDRAAVLVNTSLYEGMPNTFLQAWARGVPTVATVDVGAPVHRVAPDVEKLSQEVENVLENPEAGQACREYFASRHSSERVLAAYQLLFRTLA